MIFVCIGRIDDHAFETQFVVLGYAVCVGLPGLAALFLVGSVYDVRVSDRP